MVKVGYVRISRPESQDPESQIKLMMDEGVPSDLIFVDSVSGLKDPMKRPAYKRMMEFIEKGTTTELIVSEFSRLGRDTKSSLFELLRIEKMGIFIKSLSDHEKFINTLPPEIQPMVTSGMMLGADLERKHISERTKWGLENAREKGTKSGKPIGRPEIKIDWDKIDEMKKKYDVSENMARKLCGYKASTFYEAKRERGIDTLHD